MKKYNKIISCASALCMCLFLACENTIPFKTQDIPQKLIVNVLFDASVETHKILLNLTGVEKVTPVTNGEIDIYINGELKETVNELTQTSEWSRPHEYIAHCRFSPGDNVYLEARTKDGQYKAYAEVTVPHPIEIEKIDTMIVETTRGYDYFRIKTTFTDDQKKKDYYRIAIDQVITAYGISDITGNDTVYTASSPLYILIREDVVLTEGQPGTLEDNDDFIFSSVQNEHAIFDDLRINGTYTMTTSVPFYIPYFYNEVKVERFSLDIRVNLISLCEAEYYYLRALNIYDSEDYDETFNPPVRFPSNLNGGVGIVGMSSRTSQLINLIENMEVKY